MFVTDHFIYGMAIVAVPLGVMGIPPEIVAPVASLAGFSEAWPDLAPLRWPEKPWSPKSWKEAYDWETYGYWHFYNRSVVGLLHRKVDSLTHDPETGGWVSPWITSPTT